MKHGKTILRRYGALFVLLALAAVSVGCFGSDSDRWMKSRTEFYQSKGQDYKKAHRNANYDYVWEKRQFP